MKFFRNREILSSTLTMIGISILAVSMGTVLWEWSVGIFVGIVCMILNILYLHITYQRYKKIQELSGDIDRMLHGDMQISLENYAEGELAILESEISKMLVRLREQQQQLLSDKKYLADSIADISHQIRTPLTSINLLVSFLSDSDISEEKRRQTIRELYELLSRIDWLITTLLKISKLDAGTIQLKSEQFSMKTLIEKSIAPLLIPIELRGQELLIEAEGDFVGDLDWTSEAVGNIVKNCMEHTPFGGKIRIYANDNPIYREIIISDTGCGIDKEDLPHIFERFYKGKHSGDKSFGVGLALARMIIKAQNGTISAENRVEGGAKFTLRFYQK